MKNFCWLVLLLVFSCKKEEDFQHGYYYWRTRFHLNSTERKALDASQLPLHLRLMDVDRKEGRWQFLGQIQFQQKPEKPVVPVIFLTNRCFLNVSEKEVLELVDRLSLSLKKSPILVEKSVQLDCDWTAGSREAYFSFLKKLKQRTGLEITSTLRLHQVRDRSQMGIPPVDGVSLMCYATSSPLENSGRNSILDLPLLKSYLKTLDTYPIKNLTVALPLYSWGIVTNHLGKHRLINALNARDLDTPGLTRTSPTTAVVAREGFYFGNYLSPGMQLRVEEVQRKELDQVLAFVRTKINHFPVLYYHLDSTFILN